MQPHFCRHVRCFCCSRRPGRLVMTASPPRPSNVCLTLWSSSWTESDELWTFTGYSQRFALWFKRHLFWGLLSDAVWSGTAISDAPLPHPLPLSRGCLPTASLAVSSPFQPPGVLSVLGLALPTARHAAPTAAALSSLGITG